MEKEEFLLTIAAAFDAAHSIRTPGGICEKLHGHSWRLEATFSGCIGAGGIVRDFMELERDVKSLVIAKLDHSNLNDSFETPTTELICRWIWTQLSPLGVVELRLWETPAYSVTYRGEQ
jgi:6-pyruvoyltetrahydropterin/6-carboxytetrahydropterin synthase